MKKNFFITTLILIMMLMITACDNSQKNTLLADLEQVASDDTIENTNTPIQQNIKKLMITVGENNFSAVMYDNSTTKAFLNSLPMTIEMGDLNGNEKFYYLKDKLPIVSEVPGQIKSGDIMLYGDNCLVVFYKNFSSSYSYTRLGYIEDVSGLEKALGNESTSVTISCVP